MKTGRDKKSALALVMVAGVLMVLSTVGVCFVKYTSAERSAASNNVDMVRAEMAAEAGLYRALCGLRDSSLYKTQCDPQDEWVYQGNELGSIGVGVPIEQAKYPSYWWIGEQTFTGTKPEPLKVYGKAVSGVVGGSYELQGDTYTLKIMDTTSQININSLGASLASTLDYLGQAIAYYNGGVNPMMVNGESKGADIALLRDQLGGKFRAKESLSSIIGDANLDLLWDYITLNSWVDIDTLARDPSKGESGYWIPEPRAPVNMNMATKPVIVALIAGLEMKRDFEVEDISFEQAVKVADAIEAYHKIGGIFKNWDQFNILIDILTSGIESEESQAHNKKKDEHDKTEIFKTFTQFYGTLNPNEGNIIKANANPNVSIRRFNPDKVAYQVVDKTDLTRYTTEFCFSSMGCYEILSLGQITSDGGKLRSGSLLSSLVRVYSVSRQTSQTGYCLNWDKISSERTTVYFNNLNHKNENNMGYVELLPQEAFPDDPKKGSDLLTFNANFTNDLNAHFALGDKTPWGTERKSSTLPLSMGGDLAIDGVLIRKGEEKFLAYESFQNLPIDQGTVAFWIKYNENDTVDKTTILFSDSPFPYSPDGGIQMNIQASIYEKNIYVTACRMFYLKDGLSDSLEYPYPYKYRKVSVEAIYSKGNEFEDHKWNHICVKWNDGTDLKLYINAKEVGETLKQDHKGACDIGYPVETGDPPYLPLIYAGKGALSKPLKNLTIDDLQIYNSDDIQFKKDDINRYKPLDMKGLDLGPEFIKHYGIKCYYGKFKCTFKLPYTPDKKIRLGPMDWTACYPTVEESVFYNVTDDIEIHYGGGKKEAGENPDGPVMINQENFDYAAYFFRSEKYPYWYMMPEKGSRESPILEDMTLYYEEPLAILSYRFLGR